MSLKIMTIHELIKMMIEMKGCQVVEAVDGQEAIEVATREHPDLILMDLNLPVLDGWEATRKIKTHEETSDIPVVAISAQCRNHWREKALAAGALDCLEKPIGIGTIDKLLKQYPFRC